MLLAVDESESYLWKFAGCFSHSQISERIFNDFNGKFSVKCNVFWNFDYSGTKIMFEIQNGQIDIVLSEAFGIYIKMWIRAGSLYNNWSFILNMKSTQIIWNTHLFFTWNILFQPIKLSIVSFKYSFFLY